MALMRGRLPGEQRGGEAAKRAFDVIVSLVALFALSPVIAIIAIWIRLDSPGPALFRQTRVGRYGHPFKILKFRTMVVNAEGMGPQVTAGRDPRITKLGAFLRGSKLDELPQLLNVIFGDMSLVGVRPEVPVYVAKWTELDREVILALRPGITDPASIKFRDEQSILGVSSNPEQDYIENILPQKIALYRRYAQEQTFLGDIRLILQTLQLVIVRRD